MRRAFVTVVLAGVLVAAGAVPSMAQMARTFEDLRADAHRGEIVSVTDQGGATTEGRVLRISANSIALVVKNETREWPASEVRWITQSRGHAGRGALIGLAAGAVIGPVLAALQYGDDDFVIFVAPFSAGLGGSIGAAIGASIRPNRVLYAAPSRSAHAFSLRVAPGVIGMSAELRF